MIRSPVPKDTDLNHYFEIMNTRGVQLEKHEILKVRLMNKLPECDHQTFAAIWDACANMDKYVQMGFTTDVRFAIFGEDLNSIQFDVDGFDKIRDVFTKARAPNTKVGNSVEPTATQHFKNIIDIFDNAKPIKTTNTKNSIVESERFNSIISFSNFLIHALKIYKSGGENEDSIPLDDKRLLDTFQTQLLNESNKDTLETDIKKFLMALLKARFLFDKYIIKRELNEDWSLKKSVFYPKSKNTDYKSSFSEDTEEGVDNAEGNVTHINHQIKMLLSMLHVSFPSQTYKHWLSGVLHYLFNSDSLPAATTYLAWLEGYNNRIFYGLFGSKPLSLHQITYTTEEVSEVFNEEHLKLGTNIHNYIFNRLDYAIWKTCTVEKKISFSYNTNARDIPTISGRFRFSNRSSVEHYYPQNPKDGHPKLETEKLTNGVDSFGNLCLISRSKNSSLSNLLPSGKKEHYPTSKTDSVESLKQQIMLSFEKWNNEEEGIKNINHHEREMIALLTNAASQ